MPKISGVIVAAILCLAGVASAALGEESFTHWEDQFRLTVPENFVAEKDPAPNVGVLIKHKQNGYPTFNVVVVPGLYKAGSLATDLQSNQILSEYGQVGINSPTISSAQKIKISGRNGFSVEVNYELGGQKLRSSVTKTSGVTRHFILTFIDRAEDFDRSGPIRQSLLGSFNTWADKEMDVAEEPKQSEWDKLIAILLALAGIAALFFGVKYLRNCQN